MSATKPHPLRLLKGAQEASRRARAYCAENAPLGALPLVRELALPHASRVPGLTQALESVCPAGLAVHATNTPRRPSDTLRAALADCAGMPLGADGLLLRLLENPALRRELDGALAPALLSNLQAALVANYSPESEIADHLASGIVGQPDALRAVADEAASGLGAFRDPQRPRGVMLLAGPTGVGKTETALALARMLGGPCIRIDCNMLSGGGGDATSLLWQLFGVGKGYRGMDDPSPFAELLANPDGVVLFDEFEKADPRLGSILLQMLDSGEVLDPQRRKISFRRAFILFTSNAGVEKAAPGIGFGGVTDAPGQVTPESLRADLLRLGHKPELLGRIPVTAIFKPMSTTLLSDALSLHAQRLVESLATRGVSLTFAPGSLENFARRSGVTLGVRPAANALSRLISRKLATLPTDRRAELLVGADCDPDGAPILKLTLAPPSATASNRPSRDVALDEETAG